MVALTPQIGPADGHIREWYPVVYYAVSDTGLLILGVKKGTHFAEPGGAGSFTYGAMRY